MPPEPGAFGEKKKLCVISPNPSCERFCGLFFYGLVIEAACLIFSGAAFAMRVRHLIEGLLTAAQEMAVRLRKRDRVAR